MSEEKKTVDWKSVELEFRAGVKSLEQIGNEFGVSKGRISQVAKRDQWVRDLSVRIKAKADAKVNEAAVNKGLNAKSDRLAEREVVEANSEVQYRVRMKHRVNLQRICVVKEKLLNHLESVVDNFGDMSEVLETLRSPDENGFDRTNDKMKKAMDRSTVIDDLKKLAEVDEKVRKGEREAFVIENTEKQASPIDELLLRIARERSGS